MALTTCKTAATYTGPLTSIPASAPPGLQLLGALLGPMTALDPLVAQAAIAKHCAPDAHITNNGTPPVPLLEPPSPSPAPGGRLSGGIGQGSKRARRAAALARVERELQRAVEVEETDGARKVWWYGQTGHVFKADAEAAEAAEAAGTEPEVVWMPEAGLWSVQRVPPGLEGEVGVGGWWVVDMMSWHDRTPIRQRRAELGC